MDFSAQETLLLLSLMLKTVFVEMFGINKIS